MEARASAPLLMNFFWSNFCGDFFGCGLGGGRLGVEWIGRLGQVLAEELLEGGSVVGVTQGKSRVQPREITGGSGRPPGGGGEL